MNLGNEVIARSRGVYYPGVLASGIVFIPVSRHSLRTHVFRKALDGILHLPGSVIQQLLGVVFGTGGKRDNQEENKSLREDGRK
jgi:hypothetical protein